MSGKLRRLQITFLLIIIWSLAVLLIKLTVGKNSTSYEERSPCFTVYFERHTKTGLGNHLCYYAALKYAAWLTGRQPFILSPSDVTKLDKAFDLDIARVSNGIQCAVREFRHAVVYAYNVDMKLLVNVDANVSIWLSRSSCSWRYTKPIEQQLRRELRFRRQLTEFAETFLSANVPRGWNASTLVRVGVHVRRGDFLRAAAVRRGFTVASKEYLERAMAYFVQRFTQVQFIVASNDLRWCRKNINASSFDQTTVNITFSVRHSTEQDLALLARCDHMIMTTGTFGWWAAWLANGTTIYYKNFPRRGTHLWPLSRTADYFPPTWIGM